MFKVTLKNSMTTRLSIAETGQSLRGFSNKVGMSHAYLSQILSEKRNPSPTIAHKIASGLGKEIEDIFLIKTFDDNGQTKEVN